MAVSGANLTLLLAFVLLFARWAGVRGWWLRGVGLLGVASSSRSAGVSRSCCAPRRWGWSLWLRWDSPVRGAAASQPAVAVVALLLIDRSVGSGGRLRPVGAGQRRDHRLVAALGGLLDRWLPRILAESMTMPLAAHLATLPVVTTLSGR